MVNKKVTTSQNPQIQPSNFVTALVPLIKAKKGVS